MSPSLTNREVEIIELIAEGNNTQDVASTLYISVRTVETHRKNIKNKLGFNNFYSVLSYVFKHEIILPSNLKIPKNRH